MTTGDPVLDAWLLAASWLFLVGVVTVGLSAVPAVARRVPRLLPYGFLTSVASLLLALAAALLRGAR
jgi:hypothetical protein